MDSNYINEIAEEYRKNLYRNKVDGNGEVFDDYESIAEINADFDKEEENE